MCTEHEQEELAVLKDIFQCLTYCKPDDDVIPVNAVLAWPLDYRGYRHVYLWLSATTTLDFEAYGSGLVQGQVWINLGMRPGTKISAPNAGSTNVFIQMHFTNERI